MRWRQPSVRSLNPLEIKRSGAWHWPGITRYHDKQLASATHLNLNGDTMWMQHVKPNAHFDRREALGILSA